MKTIAKNIYEFDELSKEAKGRAIDEHREENLDYDWWQFEYEEAATIGLQITGFDISLGWADISGDLTMSGKEVADLIIENHGPDCSTTKTAKSFLLKYQPIAVTARLLGTDEAQEEADEKIEELAEDFKKQLLKDYWQLLDEQYEYLNSDEAVAETLQANDYEFYEDGTKYFATRKKKVA